MQSRNRARTCRIRYFQLWELFLFHITVLVRYLSVVGGFAPEQIQCFKFRQKLLKYLELLCIRGELEDKIFLLFETVACFRNSY
jgi:hypothetical protein